MSQLGYEMTLSDVHGLHGQSAVIALRRHLVSVRVTAVYAAVLAVIGSMLLALGPNVQSAVVSRASTNLYNLTNGHLATLVASGFVTDGGEIYLLLPGLVCLLALGSWSGGARG